MTSWEVVLVLAGVSAAIMVVLGLLTLRPHLVRVRRYRPGEQWDYPPVLWTANPPGGAPVGPVITAAARHGVVPAVAGDQRLGGLKP